MSSDVLTVREAAQILRCSTAHLSHVLNGKVPGVPPLPHIELGRRKLIRRASLDEWMQAVERSHAADATIGGSGDSTL